MTKPWNRIDPTHQTEFAHQTGFARAVAVEVEQALLRRDAKNGDAVVAGKIAGAVAAATVLLAPGDLQAIDTALERLPGIVLQFVRALAAGAASRDPVASAPGSARAQNRLAGNDDIDLMRVEDWAGRVAGPTFLEENLGISRSTLHRWQRSGKVVALRTGGRKHVFPLAQFVDGRPAPGIGEVLSLMPNPRRAWSWLISPAAGLDGRIPIEMLKQDLVADVVLVAQGTLTAKFD